MNKQQINNKHNEIMDNLWDLIDKLEHKYKQYDIIKAFNEITVKLNEDYKQLRDLE